MTLFLLLLGAQRHYAWELSTQQALVWNVCGSVTILLLLWIVVWKHWTKLNLFVAGWWSLEELQTITCSTLFMWRPWPVPQGEAMCSSLIGFNLSSLGILCVALLLLSSVRTDRSKN